MQRGVTWHGSRQASIELLDAIAHNCTCRIERGIQQSVCAAHRMLVEDQRAMDGLLFERSISAHLIEEEWRK